MPARYQMSAAQTGPRVAEGKSSLCKLDEYCAARFPAVTLLAWPLSRLVGKNIVFEHLKNTDPAFHVSNIRTLVHPC